MRALSEGVSLVACPKATVRSTAPAAAVAAAAAGSEGVGWEGQVVLGDRERCTV